MSKTLVADIGYFVGLLGVLFGANSYYQLWRWARDCQHARIAIAFKRKVVLQAPLVEWLLWARKARKDHGSRGRVVYRQAGTSVAVTQAVYPPGKLKKLWWKITKTTPENPHVTGPITKAGRWGAKNESKVTRHGDGESVGN